MPIMPKMMDSPSRNDDIEEAQDKPIDYLGEHNSQHALLLYLANHEMRRAARTEAGAGAAEMGTDDYSGPMLHPTSCLVP